MVEVKVPKNIMVYESKVIGPFTTKQFVCILVALAFDFLLFNFVLNPLNAPREVVFYAIAFLDVPILAFGYYKPMGLSFDKYIKMIYNTVILAPAKRINKKEMIQHKTEDTNKKIKQSKKHKAYK